MILLRDSVNAGWLQFDRPVESIESTSVREVLPLLRRLEKRVRSKRLFAVGFLSYESAPAFDEALQVKRPNADLPLLWFGLYESPDRITDLPVQDTSSYSMGNWVPNLDRNEYLNAIHEIREYLEQGETYQVNFTFRQHASFQGDPVALFRDLYTSQPTAHSVFLENDRFAICSVSPELFFRRTGDKIMAKPMKGTADRGKTLSEDQALADSLRESEKERAENVMIVDMLRNDIGRIARSGSVDVPVLFEVERHPTVWQMTSEVTAETDADHTEVFTALFPCASVTGAPKTSTMRIIAELERSPRGVYTGAVGYIGPDNRAQFNVGIRTVTIDKRRERAEYGTGSGIVWYSRSEREYDECLMKAKVLTERRPDFSLLESILWEGESGYFLLEYHFARLRDSAEYFGIPTDMAEIRGKLAALKSTLGESQRKIRLLVRRTGEILEEYSAPIDNRSDSRTISVGIAGTPVDREDPFLYHKTTHRSMYEQFQSENPDSEDVLLWNRDDEITETCVANFVAKIDGRLCTPPVSCGLLPGTFRSYLLERGEIEERVITRQELRHADNTFRINSVRKWQKIQITGE